MLHSCKIDLIVCKLSIVVFRPDTWTSCAWQSSIHGSEVLFTGLPNSPTIDTSLSGSPNGIRSMIIAGRHNVTVPMERFDF